MGIDRSSPRPPKLGEGRGEDRSAWRLGVAKTPGAMLSCCLTDDREAEGPVRITTLFRRLLGVTSLFVKSVEFTEDGLEVEVTPTWRKPRCGSCGRQAPGYDQRPPRRWRHLGLGSVRVWLKCAVRRVRCPECGVKVEAVPWAEHGSRFTRDFEELAAYMAQSMDKTRVTELLGISWPTVGAIVKRIVARRLDSRRFDGVKRIGVDEFSYRRRHRYLTTVVDHDRKRVIWAAPGRSAETLEDFFDELGDRLEELESVTMDMAGGYMKALAKRAPHAQIVFDRFHVQRLATDALDAVRRIQLREIRGTHEGRELFRSRFALLKNPWNLTPTEAGKLHTIQRTNKPLYRAYLLKEALRQALEYKQPWRVARALRDWLAWASRSRLRPFVKVARTVRKHFDGILAYARERLTDGIVEGFNNKLRTIARRAYGFHSPAPLIGMLYLCCGGIELDPPLPR